MGLLFEWRPSFTVSICMGIPDVLAARIMMYLLLNLSAYSKNQIENAWLICFSTEGGILFCRVFDVWVFTMCKCKKIFFHIGVNYRLLNTVYFREIFKIKHINCPFDSSHSYKTRTFKEFDFSSTFTCSQHSILWKMRIK